MKSYYTGKNAELYNQRWKVFSQKTLAYTFSAVDILRLQRIEEAQGYPLRILDVGCGTGLLLQCLASVFRRAELYGVDASQDMLDQARLLLKDRPQIHFVQASLTEGKTAGLPYEPASFDLITCMNTIHYFKDPVAVLKGLTQLLAPQGQLVVEDYARRRFPFPWKMFERQIKRVDPQHMRAYTLAEARDMCRSAGLQVIVARDFSVDLLWRGWVIQGEIRELGEHVEVGGDTEGGDAEL